MVPVNLKTPPLDDYEAFVAWLADDVLYTGNTPFILWETMRALARKENSND